MSPALITRYLTMTDGARLVWRVGGQSEGAPALLFIHGWACTQETWDPCVAFFAETHRVITLDLAGHGASSTATRNWTIEEFAADVVAAVEASGASHIILIGHSMGGAVALEAARVLGRRAIGVIGVDSFTYEGVYPRQSEFAIAQFVDSLAGDFPSSVRHLVQGFFLPNVEPTLAESVLSMMASARVEVALPALAGLLRWDLDRALQSVPTPVVTVNSADFLTPSAAAACPGRIHIETVAGAGHFLMLERPAELNSRLKELIDRMSREHEGGTA